MDQPFVDPMAGSGTIPIEAAGLAVGTGMGYLLVHVLRPLFILDPGLTFPIGGIATLGSLAIAATLASALTAATMLRRLRPTELLRET